MELRNCVNAQRGCTEKVSRGALALVLHQQKCEFYPVQCSNEGCTVTLNRKDLVSHQESCDFRSVTCSDCHETLKQKDYGNHACVLRRELTDVRRMLQQMQVSKGPEKVTETTQYFNKIQKNSNFEQHFKCFKKLAVLLKFT